MSFITSRMCFDESPSAMSCPPKRELDIYALSKKQTESIQMRGMFAETITAGPSTSEL
jgi:hypothetical protein